MSKEPSLDDLLNDEPQAEVDAPETVAETEAQPEAEAPEELSASKAQREALAEDEKSDAPLRDEKGRFAPKGEKEAEQPQAEATPAPQDTEGTIPIAALKDERAKRQALEAELNQLRQQPQQQPQAQQHPTQQQAQPQSWFDRSVIDENLFNEPSQVFEWFGNNLVSTIMNQMPALLDNYTVNRSARQFAPDKPDYNEAVAAFGELSNSDPTLLNRLYSSANPAEFAYQTGKQALEIRRAGGLQNYVQQEAQRLAAEQQQQLGAVVNKLPSSAPPTISNDRSVAPRTTPQFSGPTPLGDILT